MERHQIPMLFSEEGAKFEVFTSEAMRQYTLAYRYAELICHPFCV